MIVKSYIQKPVATDGRGAGIRGKSAHRCRRDRWLVHFYHRDHVSSKKVQRHGCPDPSANYTECNSSCTSSVSGPRQGWTLALFCHHAVRYEKEYSFTTHLCYLCHWNATRSFWNLLKWTLSSLCTYLLNCRLGQIFKALNLGVITPATCLILLNLLDSIHLLLILE